MDALTGDDIAQLSDFDLSGHAHLLNFDDRGLTPAFWTEARLVGIPRPGTLETRFLTILSGLYRCWAKRLL